MTDQHDAREGGDVTLDVMAEGRRHAVELEQCALFVDSAPLARSMTDAARFLRRIFASDARLAEILARIGHPVDRQEDGAGIPVKLLTGEPMSLADWLNAAVGWLLAGELDLARSKIEEVAADLQTAPTPPAPVGLVEAVRPEAIQAALKFADDFMGLAMAYSSAGIEAWQNGTVSDKEHVDARREVEVAKGEHARLEAEFLRWWAPRDGFDGPIRALDATLSDQTSGAGKTIDRPIPDFDFTPSAFLATLRKTVDENNGLTIILPEKATRDMLAWAESLTSGAVPAGDLRPGLKYVLGRVLSLAEDCRSERIDVKASSAGGAGVIASSVGGEAVCKALERDIRARLAEQPGGGPVAAGEADPVGKPPKIDVPTGWMLIPRNAWDALSAARLAEQPGGGPVAAGDRWAFAQKVNNRLRYGGVELTDEQVSDVLDAAAALRAALAPSADGHGRSTSAPDAVERKGEDSISEFTLLMRRWQDDTDARLKSYEQDAWEDAFRHISGELDNLFDAFQDYMDHVGHTETTTRRAVLACASKIAVMMIGVSDLAGWGEACDLPRALPGSTP